MSTTNANRLPLTALTGASGRRRRVQRGGSLLPWPAALTLLSSVLLGGALLPSAVWSQAESCESEKTAASTSAQTSRTGQPVARPAPPDPAVEPPPVSANRGTGLRVFVDPRTGLIRSEPTPAQREALRVLEARAAAGSRPQQPRVFSLPDGTKGAYLDGAFLSSTHVHRGVDGALRYDCREQHLGGDAAAKAHGDAAQPRAGSKPKVEAGSQRPKREEGALQ